MNHPGQRLYGTVLIVLVLGIAATYYVFGSSLPRSTSPEFLSAPTASIRGRRPNPRSERRQGRPGHPQGADVKIDFHYDHGYRVRATRWQPSSPPVWSVADTSS